MEQIKPGKHVSLIYDVYVVNADGTDELVHQIDPDAPESIIFGVTQGVIVPLEKALDGKEKGSKFDVVAEPDEAFGQHMPEQVMELEKDMFYVDGKFDSDIVAVGKYVPMLTADGFRMSGLVLEITDKMVKMDFNHPLAGKKIRFKGQVVDVRDATPEEIHIATSQGCGGNCGGGCNCGDDCGCGEGCGCK